MKYNVVQLLTDPAQYRITGPNCQFDFGWDRSTVAHHVCGELNRLDERIGVLEEALQVQVEAKCNALRQVTDLEALGVVDLPVKPTLNDWEDATHQITFDGGKHWTNVELDGDCFTACSDGKRSWSVDSIVPANVVARPEDPVKSIVNAAELGTMIHETLNRLTKAISETQLAPMITTNHFAPDKKLKRKNRKLKKRILELENERDELLSEIRACGQHTE